MYPRASFRIGAIAWLWPALALVALSPARAARNDAIVISAVAARDYVRPVGADGQPPPETYAFMEGAHFASATADASEKKMTFDTITRVLAVNLAKQNYFPTRDLTGAKLLIRVFWGTTLVYEDPQQLENMDSLNAAMTQFKSDMDAAGIADPGRVNEVKSAQAGERGAANLAVTRNAALLGYTHSLDKLSTRIIGTGDEIELRHELGEERYFVVLLAYDYEQLRQTKKARLLWITRLSIRSPGNNFTEALPMLALAGAQSYGHNLDDMQRVRVHDLPGGEVKMPEMKVLGAEEKPARTGEK